MTYVDDLQRIIRDAVIDQVRKRDYRKHPNAGHISRTTEVRIFRKQLADRADTAHDGAACTPIVLHNIFVNSVDISAGTPNVPEPHSPHFFQSAAIS